MATMREIIEGPETRLQLADELRLAIVEILPFEKNMIMSGSGEEIQKNEEELIKHRAIFLKKFENMQNIASAQGRQRLANVAPLWVRWTALQDRMRELVEQNNQTEAKALSLKEGRELKNQIVRELEGISEVNSQFVKQSQQEAETRYENARIFSSAQPRPRF